MMRPVFNLDLQQIELIGTFEQVYLDISISEDEIRPNVSMAQIKIYIKYVLYILYTFFKIGNFI